MEVEDDVKLRAAPSPLKVKPCGAWPTEEENGAKKKAVLPLRQVQQNSALNMAVGDVASMQAAASMPLIKGFAQRTEVLPDARILNVQTTQFLVVKRGFAIVMEGGDAVSRRAVPRRLVYQPSFVLNMEGGTLVQSQIAPL
mmetsp:Transcript_18046/g.31927  ORF Transcript_18046/g.31927 Transcript_18046/m.31927 type:complete len:141 (-) Transcript_18046:505-927(-)